MKAPPTLSQPQEGREALFTTTVSLFRESLAAASLTFSQRTLGKIGGDFWSLSRIKAKPFDVSHSFWTRGAWDLFPYFLLNGHITAKAEHSQRLEVCLGLVPGGHSTTGGEGTGAGEWDSWATAE